MLSFLMAMLRRIKYNLSRNGINTSAVCKRIFFIQRKTEQSLLCSDVVRVAGLEPVQSCLHKNLNLARLPIPPYPHIKFCPLNFTRRGYPRRSLLSDKSYFRLVPQIQKRISAILPFSAWAHYRTRYLPICRTI